MHRHDRERAVEIRCAHKVLVAIVICIAEGLESEKDPLDGDRARPRGLPRSDRAGYRPSA